MIKHQHILSVDWGTTRLRVSLVDRQSNTIRSSTDGAVGIKTVFAAWQNQPNTDRILFFKRVLKEYIDKLAEKTQTQLGHIPVIISGMASSSIGMKELPYADLPLQLDGAHLVAEAFPPTEAFPHPILLISGASKPSDVMRGEEVQALGFLELFKNNTERTLLILPGTHAKHIWLDKQTITDFKTFMTGELFQLLSEQSILKYDLTTERSTAAPLLPTFDQGVLDAQINPLTHSIFGIRAQCLQRNWNGHQGRDYLSGLLIGLELKALPMDKHAYIAANKALEPRYQRAGELLFKQITFLSEVQSNQLALLGQLATLQSLSASLPEWF